jgi:hypothetical protein
LLVAALMLGACGYRAVYSAERPTQRLSVRVGAPRSPDLAAAEAAVSGARAELSSAGVLGADGTFPRLDVEVLRVDEVGTGVAESPRHGNVPEARGSGVAVVVRGLVYEQPGIVARDSGNVRRAEWVSSASGSADGAMTYDAAVRAASRRAGRAVARRVLGIPEPANEAP